jgi:hypothetical protein
VTPRDVGTSLRKLSALRALCSRLPHLTTPIESQRLARFHSLVESPDLTTAEDVEAMIAGWRAWWRAGRVDELVAMARRLPRDFVERDRHLAMYLVAARERRASSAP